MNQPLGRAVGNSLEIEECVEILRGEANEAAQPVLDLSLELCSAHARARECGPEIESAHKRLEKFFDSGKALDACEATSRRKAGSREFATRRAVSAFGKGNR